MADPTQPPLTPTAAAFAHHPMLSPRVIGTFIVVGMGPVLAAYIASGLWLWAECLESQEPFLWVVFVVFFGAVPFYTALIVVVAAVMITFPQWSLHFICKLLLWYGRVYHGYELRGWEHIDPTKPGLIIIYHGPNIIDFMLMIATVYERHGVLIQTMGDRFLFMVPMLRKFYELSGVHPGSRETCRRLLSEGKFVAAAPGGVREALFSGQAYEILWGGRKGFARMALECKVPVYPMFTQHVQSSFATLGPKKVLRWVYTKTRLPIVYLFGTGVFLPFPCRLRTFFGAPVPLPDGCSADEAYTRIKRGLRELIETHQHPLPGTRWAGLKARFSEYEEPDKPEKAE